MMGPCHVSFTVTAENGTLDKFDLAIRRLGMKRRGYKMAPVRKRPKRLAKKIAARFGVAHPRDHVVGRRVYEAQREECRRIIADAKGQPIDPAVAWRPVVSKSTVASTESE